MLNVITGDKKNPTTILIRGAGHITDPVKLTSKLSLNKTFDMKPLSQEIGVWIEDRIHDFSKKTIMKSPRVGAVSSGPIWSKKAYRFFIPTLLATQKPHEPL